MRMTPAMTSKTDDDLAEHLPALQPRQPALDLAERELAVDHRRHAAGHLGEAFADVAHRGAKRADDTVLLLKELHQIERRRGSGGRPAGDEPAAALEAQERAVEGLRPDMLEHDVDALLGGELAHDAFETLGAVVDHVIGAQGPGHRGL